MTCTMGNVEEGPNSRPPRGDRPRTSFGPPPRGGRGGRGSGTERTNVPTNPNEAGPSSSAPSSSYISLGGPCLLDPTLLSLQSHHRSKDMWKGESKECTFRGGHPLLMHPRIYEILRDYGLYGIALMSSIKCDRPLLTALLERWRPETYTFHLPVGEMIVILQDVFVLIGLPVDGQAVTDTMDFDPVYLVEQYLGVEVETAVVNGKFIRLKWLKDTFMNRLNEDSTEEEVSATAGPTSLHYLAA